MPGMRSNPLIEGRDVLDAVVEHDGSVDGVAGGDASVSTQEISCEMQILQLDIEDLATRCEHLAIDLTAKVDPADRNIAVQDLPAALRRW